MSNFWKKIYLKHHAPFLEHVFKDCTFNFHDNASSGISYHRYIHNQVNQENGQREEHFLRKEHLFHDDSMIQLHTVSWKKKRSREEKLDMRENWLIVYCFMALLRIQYSAHFFFGGGDRLKGYYNVVCTKAL